MIYALLIGYSVAMTLLAMRFYNQRNSYKIANTIRADAIEATRKGNPPFLLNPGVKIIVEDPQ